jgi:hypothetical protein
MWLCCCRAYQFSRPFPTLSGANRAFTCCTLNGIGGVRVRRQPPATVPSPTPQPNFVSILPDFIHVFVGGDRSCLYPIDLLGSGDALFPHFYHRRVHSSYGRRTTPLLTDTPAETPPRRPSFGHCWFQGFHEASPKACASVHPCRRTHR